MTETETTEYSERAYGDLNPANLRVAAIAAVIVTALITIPWAIFASIDSRADSDAEQKGYEACMTADFSRDSELLDCIDEIR